MLPILLRRLAPALIAMLALTLAAKGQHDLLHARRDQLPPGQGQHGQAGCGVCAGHQHVLHAIHEHLMAAHAHIESGRHGKHEIPAGDSAEPMAEAHAHVLHSYAELGKALRALHALHVHEAHARAIAPDGQHGRHEAEPEKAKTKEKSAEQKAEHKARIRIFV